MINCILLSAGYSRRFGSSKALAQISKKNVIEHLQEQLLQANINEITIVLGASADQIKPFILKHKRIKFVYNKDYNFGQTSSFKAGLKSLSAGTKAMLLLPIDYPLVNEATINNLINVYKDKHPKIVIPTYHSKKGHPPLFDISLKDEFLNLDDTQGLNCVASSHPQDTLLYPVDDNGVIRTFNTPEEFQDIIEAVK